MKTSYFKDKVVIITGASSGIGLASAKLFGSYGACVVMASRSIDRMLSLAPSVSSDPEKVMCVRTDVCCQEDCRNLIDRTVERFGRIDILVNNAGLSMRAMFLDLDLDVVRRLMDVNFWGTVYYTKYALPWLLKSKGSLVGVVSVASFSALPARTAYSASKYAVRGFLDTVRIEHLHEGLHVLVFAPGYTSSNVRNSALTADGSPQGETPLDESKLMSAGEVALRLSSALYHRRSQSVLTLLGKATVLMHNVWPSLVDRITYRYISKENNSPFK